MAAPAFTFKDLEGNSVSPKMFQALSAYEITGIPAKIVIDANGKQRVLTTGFTSDTELINEKEAMIQLAAEQLSTA